MLVGTNPRAWKNPLDPQTATDLVTSWLTASPVWTPEPGPGHAEILLGLLTKYQVRGNLVLDAQLAALAIEYGLAVYSADTDFARFTGLTWRTQCPVSARSNDRRNKTDISRYVHYH